MATVNCLVTKILQNNLFCVKQSKESFEQLEDQKMTEFSLSGKLSLSFSALALKMSVCLCCYLTWITNLIYWKV